jgi:hypothetical protein
MQSPLRAALGANTTAAIEAPLSSVAQRVYREM